MAVRMEVETLAEEAKAAFAAASDAVALENEKARFLGKSGRLTALLRGLASMSSDERKVYGSSLHHAKSQIEEALAQRRQTLARDALEQSLAAEAIDVSLPGRGQSHGSLHPVMRTWERVERLFQSVGFNVAYGPEVENDWMNFGALNSPADHPARSMQDTFYLEERDAEGRQLLLRTHTSPMQLRYAQQHIARYKTGIEAMRPIKVIAPGRAYRVDNDATHSPVFHQVEGLWIGAQVSFADLKGVYSDFLHQFFADNSIRVRFRPSYFPFTEPSAEVDVALDGGPWLEISGAGQVHPRVLSNMGLNPEEYMGFAFGSGLERLAMLLYGIEDLRTFYAGDIGFLAQFPV